MLRAPIPAALPTRRSSSPSPPCSSSSPGCNSPLHTPGATFNELDDDELDGYHAPSGLQAPEAALPRTDLGRERLFSEKCAYSISSFYDGEPITPPLVQATFSSFRDDVDLSSVNINSNSACREKREGSSDSNFSKRQLSSYTESPLRAKSSNSPPTSNITMGSIVDVPNCLIQKNTGRPARLSRRSSFRKLRNTSLHSLIRPSVVGPSQSTGSINPHQQQKWVEEFRLLETELPKFIARTGTNKANVLRLSLLPFLRAQKGELATIPTFERQRRLHLFQRWWTSILSSLTGKKSVARSDISAFLEAISGLMSRREWRDQLDYNNSMSKSAEQNSRSSSKQENQAYQFSAMYQNSLIDTLAYAISKVSGRALPVSFSAFTGKVLAYSFYYSSAAANPLLYLLKVDQKDIDRVLTIALREEHEKKIFQDTVQMICTDLNSDVQRLIGLTTALDPNHKPSVPAKLQLIYDGWTIRWTSRDSDIFTSFLKHYYMLSFDVLPDISSPSTLLAAPGMVLLQAYILRLLDDTVHRPTNSANSIVRPALTSSIPPSKRTPRLTQQQQQSTRNIRSRWDPNTSLNESMPRTSCRGPSKQLYELKLFRLMQELLYCDDACMRYSEPTGRLFHHLLEAVVIRTKLYDVEACIALCDLSEEYLATLCLDDSSRNVVNWEFWRQVLGRMLSSNNHFIELRALAFLFNIWGQIAVHDSENENEAGNLRLIFTKWILSLKNWTYFFCHWSPLVRAYYLRLLCWRVGRVESLTPSSQDIRIQKMILNRFYSAYDLAKEMDLQHNNESSLNPTCYTPHSPLAGRILTISRNTPAIGRPMSRMSAPLCSVIFPSFQDDVLSANGKDTGYNPPCLRRVDCFEVYDDMLYTHSKRIQTPQKEDQRYNQSGNHPWQSSSPSFSESLATVDSLSQGFSDGPKSTDDISSNGPNWSPSGFMKGLKNVFGISSSRSPSPIAELPSPQQVEGEAIKKDQDYRDPRATISASSSSTCVSALTPPSLVSDTSSNSGPDYDDIKLQNGRFTPTLSFNREESDQESPDAETDQDIGIQVPMPRPNLSRRLSKRVSFSLLPLSGKKPDAVNGRRSASLQEGSPVTLSSRASADDLSRLKKQQQQQSLSRPRSLARSFSSNALSQRSVSGTSDDGSDNGDFVRSPFAKRDKLRMKRPLFKFIMCPSNFGQFSVAGYSGNPILAALPPTQTSSLDLHVSRKDIAASAGRVRFRSQSVLLNRDDITGFAGPRLPFQSRTQALNMADLGDESEPLFDEGDNEQEFLSSFANDTHQRRVWWKYAGRAINEWELIVCSFEEFVRLRKEVDGVARIEDVGTPILLADIPAKITSNHSSAD